MNKDLRITITLLACAFVGLLEAGTIIALIVKELKQEERNCMNDLTPPDYKQCQVYKPNGVNFVTLGGSPKMIRCKNKPAYTATENAPGEDGKIGSMSLCPECADIMKQQCGEGFATLTPIIKARRGREIKP